MNICLLITDYFPNIAGAEIFAKNLAENLITHNHKVIIITAKKNKLKKYEVINNVKVFRVKSPIFPYGFIITGFLKAIKLRIYEKIDMFHAILAHYPGTICLILKLLFRENYILTIQGGDILDYSETRKFLFFTYPLLKMIIKNAKIVHAVSKSVAEKIVKIYPRPVKIIPNGINTDHFKKYPTKHIERIRNKLKIKDNEFILITTSRLVPKNNIKLVLKALKYINDNSIRFLIIGTGILYEQLNKFIKENNLNAQLLGYIPNDLLPAYLSIADIFVRTPIDEGFGISFLEAMACKLPIIASNVGGICDFIINDFNGILVNSNDYKLLANKIVFLRKNPKMRENLIRNANETLKKFEIPQITSKIEELYKLFLKK
ncbi:MAG: glycosyltransferase family 4 protein [Candidatus Helarchaeota archaeon]